MAAENNSLFAYNPDKGKTTPIDPVATIPLFPFIKAKGNAEYKSRVVVRAAKEGKRQVSLIHKGVVLGPLGEVDIQTARKFYATWKMLKNAGIPTIPTVRIIAHREVLMTDLTADGSYLYGKAEATFGFTDRYEPPTVTDKIFRSLDLTEVEKEA